MARSEVTRSPFSPQLSASSAKLRIYESLFLWNQSIDQVVAILLGMAEFPFADKKSLHSAQAEIEEVRAAVNAVFAEKLAARERLDQGRFWKKRRAHAKALRDPDDVYLEVECREQERRQQGLPPRIGIVPYPAATEEKPVRNASKQKKRRPRQRAKSTLSAQGRVSRNGYD